MLAGTPPAANRRTRHTQKNPNPRFAASLNPHQMCGGTLVLDICFGHFGHWGSYCTIHCTNHPTWGENGPPNPPVGHAIRLKIRCPLWRLSIPWTSEKGRRRLLSPESRHTLAASGTLRNLSIIKEFHWAQSWSADGNRGSQRNGKKQTPATSYTPVLIHNHRGHRGQSAPRSLWPLWLVVFQQAKRPRFLGAFSLSR